MKDISEIISTAWKLKRATEFVRVAPEHIGLIVRLEDAKRIRDDMQSLLPPGANNHVIRVPWIAESRGGPEFSSEVPIPEEPVPGQKWFDVFRVPIYVLDC